MKEVEEFNPAVFVVTTSVLASYYGLGVVNLVGTDALNNAMRKCLEQDRGIQLEKLTDIVRQKLGNILKLTRASLEDAFPLVLKEATELVAA